MGNYMEGSATVTADNWKGVHPDDAMKLELCKVSTRWTEGLTELKHEQTAEAAYETVLSKAGCSLHRDAIDTRIVNEVRNGTGKLINTQTEVGGWPELQSTNNTLDSDDDGIPDEWENTFGLNPVDPLDAKAITLVTGFTNIEVYMRHLVRDLYD